MKARGRLDEGEAMPDVTRYRVLVDAYRDLLTERNMDGNIPVSRIHQYLTRHRLPEYWEPAILAIDANKTGAESDNGDNRTS